MSKCMKCETGELFKGNDGITYCTDCDYTKEHAPRKGKSKDPLGHIFKIGGN